MLELEYNFRLYICRHLFYILKHFTMTDFIYDENLLHFTLEEYYGDSYLYDKQEIDEFWEWCFSLTEN